MQFCFCLLNFVHENADFSVSSYDLMKNFKVVVLMSIFIESFSQLKTLKEVVNYKIV